MLRPEVGLEVREEQVRSALSANESPDVPFRYSLNPYRGCFHACAYCYARPTHAYLDLGSGTEFDRHIVVKKNIVERLQETFESKRWRGETIAFSGNTDCYQPLEARYGLTRACLELCLRYRNPVGIVTKGLLIRRDIALLAELEREAGCSVAISIAFASDADAKRLEPYASPPSKRFLAIRHLAEAGIPTHLLVAPIVPSLNDAQIPEVLERAKAAGVRSASMLLLRLNDEVAPVFEARLREAYPLRADHILSSLRQMRAGEVGERRFGERMRGVGERFRAVESLFSVQCRRLGLAHGTEVELGIDDARPSPFRRPSPQLELFD